MLLTLIENALWQPICDTYAQGCEAGAQRTFDAAPPTDFLPLGLSQHRLGRDRELIGDLVLARPASSRHRKDQGNAGRIDFLMFGNANGPGKPSGAQPLTERGRQAVAGVGKNSAEPYACCCQPVDLFKRDFGLAARPVK